jgi:hypothetical protein
LAVIGIVVFIGAFTIVFAVMRLYAVQVGLMLLTKIFRVNMVSGDKCNSYRTWLNQKIKPVYGANLWI